MKTKRIILSLLAFGFLFSVFNTLEAKNPAEENPAEEENIKKTENRDDVIGYVSGTWTKAENGGYYCSGCINVCCDIVAGENIYIMPYRSGKKGDKIKVTKEQIEALRDGEVIHLE